MPEIGLTLFDLQPGKLLQERFEIVRSLRQSGLAQVFEVKDRAEDAARQLLVFPAALFEGGDQSTDFADVMRAWRAVESPAVVQVRDVVRYEDGTLLVSTELPPEHSMREWLKNHGHMEASQARKLGQELCRGLVAIHASGLVHGDIKPYTIHVGREKKPARAVMVDGGITPGLWSAKHLGDRTVLIGTPFYSPVEQFGGESPNVSSDLYNVATVLYELVTGVVPWAGRNFLEVFQAKLQPTPAMNRRAPEIEVPAGYEKVVQRALSTDEEERYATAEELHDALAKIKG
jgi:serine/threonine-protein kinase